MNKKAAAILAMLLLLKQAITSCTTMVPSWKPLMIPNSNFGGEERFWWEKSVFQQHSGKEELHIFSYLRKWESEVEQKRDMHMLVLTTSPIPLTAPAAENSTLDASTENKMKASLEMSRLLSLESS